MEDLETFGLWLVEYTTPSMIGTFHGRLRKFGFEASRTPPPRIGTSHAGLRKFGLEAGRIPPFPVVMRITAVYIPQVYHSINMAYAFVTKILFWKLQKALLSWIVFHETSESRRYIHKICISEKLFALHRDTKCILAHSLDKAI